MFPLQSLPPELVTALLEQGGPTVAAVGILWWRINKLEEQFSDRIDRIDEDVDANSSLIYDRLLDREYPKPDDDHAAAARDVEVEPARSSSD